MKSPGKWNYHKWPNGAIDIIAPNRRIAKMIVNDPDNPSEMRPGREEAEDNAAALVSAVNNVEEALKLISDFGGIAGDHHKTWVIDQVVRKLAGEGYQEWVRQQKAGEDGPETYDWDEGIAP